MGSLRAAAIVGLGLGGLCAAAPSGPVPAASAAPSCSALGGVDEKIGDMRFDLDNLRAVMRNAYASIDVKKHDEDFRLKTMVNAFGFLERAVGEAGDPALSRQFETVKPHYRDMRDAVDGQFVVVQDEHYDFYSSTRYQAPRLTGTGADPEAFGAIDALDGDLQALADAVGESRGRQGCPAPDDDGAGADESAPDGTEPPCRFHPGSYQCDATGSIEH